VPEAPGLEFEDPEPDFDERAVSPGFAFAVKEFEQSVVPGAAAGPHQRATATPLQHSSEKQKHIRAQSDRRHLENKQFQGITTDRRPDVNLLAVDFDFCLVDGYLLTVLSLRLK